MTTQAKKDFLDKVQPIADTLLDYAMKQGKAHGITDAKVSISTTENQKGSVRDGAASELVSGTRWMVSVTLYAGRRRMSCVKNTLDIKKLTDAMQENMQVIHLVPENENGLLLAKEKVAKQPDDSALDLYEEQQPSQAEMIDYARKYEAAALAVDGIKTTDRLKVSKSVSQSYIKATNGLELHQAGTSYSASGEAIAESANGMEAEGDYSMALHFGDMTDPAQLGRNMAQAAVAKLDAVVPKTGEMPIVLNHDAAEQFFSDTVFEAIDGSNVFKGDTFLKGQKGQQVMSESVTLVDDPLVVRGLGSGTLDSAGVEMKPMAFIENGILRTFNAGVMEARQIGMEPIGREDGPTNCSVLPGKQTPEELIADIKEGIYIKGFNGGTVNTSNGTHSREAYGLLIKDGKITNTAVAGFVVSGNLKKMFMNVALANDTPKQPNTKHSIAAPTMRIDGCLIAGQ
jgi:PmbA protein